MLCLHIAKVERIKKLFFVHRLDFLLFLLYVSFFLLHLSYKHFININTNQMKLLINLYLFAFGGYIVGHFINYFINL